VAVRSRYSGISVLLLAWFLFGMEPQVRAAGLVGTWVWQGLGRETPVPGGPHRWANEVVLVIEREGDRIEGRFESPLMRLPLSGERKEERIMLVAGSPDRGLPFVGELRGERLELLTPYPGAREPLPLVLRRATEPEIAALPPPVAPLSLPAVRELPPNGLALTPPMGWNSWNHFETDIDDATVRAIADAMVSSGMRDAGYVYVNIDDGWQGRRDESGRLQPNERFPDMKGLADYVHSRGLKLGIYSSPGPRTCAYYEGSLGHEEQDARTFAEWGIDYLKYDWCSARAIYREDQMRAVYQKMAEALRATGRDIVYSLCQYGLADVWSWGPASGGNLWRTTGDISDDWRVMSWIGFGQGELAPFAGPGHWNDPDMLEIGNPGLTAIESRTHMSLWALLAAPLLAGNDLRRSSAETVAILTHPEVIAIDQDSLGAQGRRVAVAGTSEIWMKPLADGRRAVGLFNRADAAAEIEVRWRDLGLAGDPRVRDVWARADLGTREGRYAVEVPGHGVALLVVTPPATGATPEPGQTPPLGEAPSPTGREEG
jgi:alpha-galactosidase